MKYLVNAMCRCESRSKLEFLDLPAYKTFDKQPTNSKTN